MSEIVVAIIAFLGGCTVTAIAMHLSRSAVYAADAAYIKGKLDALWTKLGGA